MGLHLVFFFNKKLVWYQKFGIFFCPDIKEKLVESTTLCTPPLGKDFEGGHWRNLGSKLGSHLMQRALIPKTTPF